jgi:hypothetical protein
VRVLVQCGIGGSHCFFLESFKRRNPPWEARGDPVVPRAVTTSKSSALAVYVECAWKPVGLSLYVCFHNHGGGIIGSNFQFLC